MTAPGIDPRSPRFGAGITAVLLLVTLGFALATPLGANVADRALEPAAILFAVIAALFAWGAVAGIRRHPYGLVFRALVQPWLSPPSEREDPRPPTFAQGVGFVISAAGLLLHLAGAPFALAVAAAAAFVAAFLNSVFGYCLGCQIYLLLARAGIVGKKGAAAA